MCSVVHQAGIDAPRYMQLAGHGRYCESVAERLEVLRIPAIRECTPIRGCESRLRPEDLDDPVLSRGRDEFNPAYFKTIVRSGALRYLECKLAAKIERTVLPPAAEPLLRRIGADEIDDLF